MSYPEPRYRGDTGEITATYRAADHEPDLVYPGDTTVHYLATGASTEGLFGLYRWEMGGSPGGARRAARGLLRGTARDGREE